MEKNVCFSFAFSFLMFMKKKEKKNIFLKLKKIIKIFRIFKFSLSPLFYE